MVCLYTGRVGPCLICQPVVCLALELIQGGWGQMPVLPSKEGRGVLVFLCLPPGATWHLSSQTQDCMCLNCKAWDSLSPWPCHITKLFLCNSDLHMPMCPPFLQRWSPQSASSVASGCAQPPGAPPLLPPLLHPSISTLGTLLDRYT